MTPPFFTRRKFLASIAGAGALAACSAAPELPPASGLPNIVLILADDLGYDGLGVQGASDLRTPSIDSIANIGVRFTDGYVTAPVCSPSRAALLTGRYQQSFGLEFGPPTSDVETPPNFGLPVHEKTLANHLHSFGYVTGLIGKWHLGVAPQFRPLRRGFDEFFGFLMGSRSYYQKTADRRNPLYSNDRIVQEPEYLTDAFAAKAVSFIERHHDEPFFLYLAFNAVHSPTDPPPQKYLDRFPHITDPTRKIFAAMLAAMDDGIGRVLSTIHRLALDDSTLVIFLSDNGGTSLAGHTPKRSVSRGKGSLSEGGIRIPFMMRWPQHLPAGAVYREPVSSLDIFSTALSAAGATIPPDRDGVDLLPFLNGTQQGRPHDQLYWKCGAPSAIRQGDWKLISPSPQAPPMLFNLVNDPLERHDLAQYEPQRRQALLDLLTNWKSRLPPPLTPQVIPASRSRQRT
ncbi:MAG TPA: sulfatase-like hydrolase/transferase [Tepidisphaeraceae bacterium]|nr:sulfatase-like hydrolase/transferase [Tepidisphaeraceae bacterium]